MPDFPPRRRGRQDIIIEILKNAKKGAKKTIIMHESNLNFAQVERYLNTLKNAGFITEESGVWKTTEKGFHVIEACEICQRLCEEAW